MSAYRVPRGPLCPSCGEIHSLQNTRVVGSHFAPGPHTYRAVDVPDAPARPTREDAMRDRCEFLTRSRASSPALPTA